MCSAAIDVKHSADEEPVHQLEQGTIQAKARITLHKDVAVRSTSAHPTAVFLKIRILAAPKPCPRPRTIPSSEWCRGRAFYEQTTNRLGLGK